MGGQDLFAYPDASNASPRWKKRTCAPAGWDFARAVCWKPRANLAADGGAAKLETFRSLDRPAALAALDRFRGVGTKVANCVLLFGYEHLDAFPIDVWIERVLRDTYFQHEPDAAVGKLQRFSEGIFRTYGGYAQQYLFPSRAQGSANRAR